MGRARRQIRAGRASGALNAGQARRLSQRAGGSGRGGAGSSGG